MSAPAFTLTAAQTPLLFAAFMTDDTQALAMGLRQRDPDLLDRLIEQYQQRLYRYLLFLTGNPSLAEDLFQGQLQLVAMGRLLGEQGQQGLPHDPVTSMGPLGPGSDYRCALPISKAQRRG